MNSQPLRGYKHGDFVKFKYNTIVYHQKKGLPMFRDVEQYGWMNNPNIMNGKVSVQPVSSDHHRDTMRVESAKIISKTNWTGNIEDYSKSAPEGFQVEPPIFDVPEGTSTYAGGDIPIWKSEDGEFTERIIPYDTSNDKKPKVKTEALEDDIKKQKAMVNGKVNG